MTAMISDASYLPRSLVARVGDFIALRREIHQHPELAFEEHRTSALVAEKLASWGYAVDRGLGGTGVVGTLKRGGSERTIGIRADMDALPIQEAVDRPWASLHPGRMHACGHDGHTATLLAAARAIVEDAQFDGTVHLIFQPAEEGQAGAARMIADGLFKRFPCDTIFALHNQPGVPAGHFAFRTGATMASSDYATIHLQGKGGHGAMPQQTADAVVAAAWIVTALQTIVARNIDPLQTAVVTVGAMHAGEANNVIADQARLELSVRALDPKVRALLKQRIIELATQQAASLSVQAQIDWRDGYPVLVNAAEATQLAMQVATEVFGPERVIREIAPITASEDFAFMLQQVPGCYFYVGNGTEGEPGACAVHNPGYDFNDAILAPAATFWVRLLERCLSV